MSVFGLGWQEYTDERDDAVQGRHPELCQALSSPRLVSAIPADPYWSGCGSTIRDGSARAEADSRWTR